MTQSTHPYPVEPVAGISLEQYAQLAAAMHESLDAPEKCEAIALAAGITSDQWQRAVEGWNQRLSDPLIGGALSSLYMELYRQYRDELQEPR